jgi:hypothetical protein
MSGPANPILDLTNDNSVRLTILILVAALLPAIWGWSIYWLVAKWWPPRGSNVSDARIGAGGSFPDDYQI